MSYFRRINCGLLISFSIAVVLSIISVCPKNTGLKKILGKKLSLEIIFLMSKRRVFIKSI